jgi:hypothetical protein
MSQLLSMGAHLVLMALIQPYNAMLSVHQLVDNGDLTICIDNEALCVRLVH